MISKIKEELLFAKAIRINNPRVQEEIMEDNRKATIFWAVVQIVFWSLSLVISRFNQEYTDCLPVYIIAIIISVASFICAIFICPKHLHLVPLVALVLNVALLGAGLGITVIKGNLRSAVVFCTLLIAPVCYITDTLSIIVLFLIDFLMLMLIGPNTMDPDIFEWTRTFFILFGVIGILMGHFINKTRFERYVYADAARQYAELQTRYAYYDQMTGLLNRRAYSEKVEELTKDLPPHCCVIMADINGLKEANDNLGHDAGDELIKGTSDCLREIFKETDTIFRIGGDEFCIILDCTIDDAARKIKDLESISAKWNGPHIKGISISCGVASSEEFSDFDSIMKAADQRMYDYKQNYYRISGKERRRQ